jgi:hypothetical protein
MTQGVEIYRGVKIYQLERTSRNEMPLSAHDDERCEAYLSGWRMVGSLPSVRQQIDVLLDTASAPPQHKSLPMI